MNFNAPLLKPIRILLFPFSLVYGAGVWIRNRLFDKKLVGSSTFNLPLICIGNLSAGGTGKSPMVEYILSRFASKYALAVLSRGYKRKTKGYVLATDSTSALDIGDEPFLFHSKFPDVSVAVGEERIVAIPQLLHDRPGTQAIIMDDAFQHRSVQAGLNIVLTDQNNLFTRDWFLPTGDLRDEKSSYKRGDILVVTKCRPDLSPDEANEIKEEIKPLDHQSVFFTSIRYATPYHLVTREPIQIDNQLEILLVTGIANPTPMKKYLADNSKAYYEMLYSDHHIFTIDDWKDIMKRFNQVPSTEKIILTTEKDAVRLRKFQLELRGVPVFALPISVEFLFDESPIFDKAINEFIAGFGKNLELHDEKARQEEAQ
ncbi:MAG TPA: tetraacyldisaccharide 4'-kinase [Flavitalea sp.]|nr:tetraacyldisaccharide 4'-kinase [Flavitalea sp.]